MSVHWATVLDALVTVERVGGEDSGFLAFGDLPQGGIFVEGGRICWVAAHGLQRRLRDLLREECALEDRVLDQAYARARAGGVLFGQSLVSDGRVSARELESVLRRHSAESLVALCREPQPMQWSSRGAKRFAARFTFEPASVLHDAVALSHRELRDSAAKELAPLATPDRAAAAFLIEAAGAQAPVPLAAAGRAMDVGALRRLGEWAARLPRAALELGSAPRFAFASRSAGASTAVWWRGGVLYAVACEDRASAAAVTSQVIARV